MTLPSLRSYLKSVVRFWYVPVICALVSAGVALGFRDLTGEQMTVGNVLFTIVVDDQGQESGGSARLQEEQLALQRLDAYVKVAREGVETQSILAEAGVDAPAAGPWRKLAGPDSLDLSTASGGIVSVKFSNGSLSDEDARDLVRQVQEVVSQTAVQLDGQQTAPSIRDTPVIADPQTILTSPTRSSGIAPLGLLVPGVLGVSLGLGLVFLLAWRYRRVEDRRDLEERLQISVVGEASGQAEDLLVIAQALSRSVHGEGSGSAILVSAPGAGPTASIAQGVMQVSQALVADTVAVVGTDQGGRPDASGRPTGRAAGKGTIELLDLTATEGMSRRLVVAAPAADMIAILVRYGHTPMRDLERMLVSLSDASVTPLGAIGFRQ